MLTKMSTIFVDFGQGLHISTLQLTYFIYIAYKTKKKKTELNK